MNGVHAQQHVTLGIGPAQEPTQVVSHVRAVHLVVGTVSVSL